MKKKFTLFIAALLTGLGFSASAAVGDTFTASGYKFKVIAEGDVNEVEFAPKESGYYNVTSTSAFSNLNTVSNGGVTYTIVGVGEYAFENAQFVANGNTNFPANIRYISDYAFKGVKSGSAESRGSIRFFGNALRYMSSKAFLDNRLQGSILITSGDAENGFAQVNSLVTSAYSTDANMYLAAEHGSKYIAFPWSYPAGTSNGWGPAYKVKIAAEIKTIGAYAMMNCTNYKQIDLGSVEVIDTAAFKNTALTTITFPASITHVAADAFEGNTTLTRVTVNCGYDAVKDMVFDDAVYNRIRESGDIHVPDADLESYQNNPNWGRFWNAAPPAAPKMYIAGSFTNWADGKLEMTESDGIYTITIPGVQQWDEFKFIEGEGDNAVWYGGDTQGGGDKYGVHPDWCTGIALTAGDVGSNFQVTNGNGDLTFTIDTDKNLTITGWAAPANELYLAGSMTNWATDKEAMTLDAETGKFSITKEMAAGAEFKFIDQDGTWIGGDADGNFVVQRDQVLDGTELTLLLNAGNNFEIPVAGIWTLTVDKATMKLVISGEWPAPKYAITVAECEHGTVQPEKDEAEQGESVTLTVTPEEGYELTSLTYTVEGDEPVAIENYSFNMPAAPVTINAIFTEIPPVESVITFEAAPANGTVAVYVGEVGIESGATVAEGAEVQVVLTPAEGYEVSAFAVTTAEPEDEPAPLPRRANVPVTESGNNTYTFEMPAEPVTITASFVESVTTAISDLRTASDGNVRYIDVNGHVSDKPFNGFNIVVNADGTVTKIVK